MGRFVSNHNLYINKIKKIAFCKRLTNLVPGCHVTPWPVSQVLANMLCYWMKFKSLCSLGTDSLVPLAPLALQKMEVLTIKEVISLSLEKAMRKKISNSFLQRVYFELPITFGDIFIFMIYQSAMKQCKMRYLLFILNCLPLAPQHFPLGHFVPFFSCWFFFCLLLVFVITKSDTTTKKEE